MNKSPQNRYHLLRFVVTESLAKFLGAQNLFTLFQHSPKRLMRPEGKTENG